MDSSDKTFVAGVIGFVIFFGILATALTTHNINAMETQKILLSKCVESKGLWISSATSSYGGHCITKE